MRLEKCPHCCHHMRFTMDYCNGNPVIVYNCDNCLYTTFGEAYIAENKTTATTGGYAANSTKTIFVSTCAKDNTARSVYKTK